MIGAFFCFQSLRDDNLSLICLVYLGQNPRLQMYKCTPQFFATDTKIEPQKIFLAGPGGGKRGHSREVG